MLPRISLLSILVTLWLNSLFAVSLAPSSNPRLAPTVATHNSRLTADPLSFYLPMVVKPGWLCAPADLILFASTETSQKEIAVICADGANRRLLTYTPGFESTSPTWSPDRTRFVFASTIAGEYGLYIYELGCACVKGIIPLPVAAYEPAWSPVDNRLAFTASGGIYTVNLDGSELTQLTESGFNPTWSPDGARIAYTVWAGGIRVLRIQEIGVPGYFQLPTPGSDYNPDWSPDGSQLAFASAQGDSVNLYIINTDGTGLRQLTDSADHEYAPSWSPDGGRIAYVVSSKDQVSVYQVNADGSAVRLLAAQADQPAWDN